MGHLRAANRYVATDKRFHDSYSGIEKGKALSTNICLFRRIVDCSMQISDFFIMAL